VPAKDSNVTYVAPNLIYHYVTTHRYLPPAVFLDALRAFSLPNPAVVWILERIAWFENQRSSITTLWNFLDRILRIDKPSVPPELRSAVLKAANELKATQSLRSDAEPAEIIVNRLKSALTKG